MSLFTNKKPYHWEVCHLGDFCKYLIFIWFIRRKPFKTMRERGKHPFPLGRKSSTYYDKLKFKRTRGLDR
ncbi:hypothetical protein BGS_0602 [Beggiatoa sp. SS]|nr:hypothetical protein BGS_0602 [Beggiatoa sp. SS]